MHIRKAGEDLRRFHGSFLGHSQLSVHRQQLGHGLAIRLFCFCLMAQRYDVFRNRIFHLEDKLCNRPIQKRACTDYQMSGRVTAAWKPKDICHSESSN